MRLAYFAVANIPIPSKAANTVHVMKMCQAFRKNGVDVTLYCMQADSEPDEKTFERYGIRTPFPIVKTKVDKFIRKIPVLGEIFSALALHRLFLRDHKAQKYDLVFGRSWPNLFLVRNRCPFMLEIHSIKSFFRGGALIRSLILNKNLQKLILISNTLKRDYLRMLPSLDENKIAVLHDGADRVDLASAVPISLDNRGSSQPNVVIGYVGHLYPGKCMEILKEVAKRTRYWFHIVGGNEKWLSHWRKVAETEGIDNIIFHGFVDNALVPAHYTAFDICILPFSQTVYLNNGKTDIGQWTSPLKLFEAMSFGKAILVSKIPTIEEVLQDGVDCLMADPADIDSWVTGLNTLVNNEELRTKLGAAAKCKLENGYTWEARAEAVASYFK